jgi:hypothetical protein
MSTTLMSVAQAKPVTADLYSVLNDLAAAEKSPAMECGMLLLDQTRQGLNFSVPGGHEMARLGYVVVARNQKRSKGVVVAPIPKGSSVLGFKQSGAANEVNVPYVSPGEIEIGISSPLTKEQARYVETLAGPNAGTGSADAMSSERSRKISKIFTDHFRVDTDMCDAVMDLEIQYGRDASLAVVGDSRIVKTGNGYVLVRNIRIPRDNLSAQEIQHIVQVLGDLVENR